MELIHEGGLFPRTHPVWLLDVKERKQADCFISDKPGETKYVIKPDGVDSRQSKST